ncbi:MAG: hypothetical protein ABJJ44_19715 [Paraglaciecola sp.]|uniref:hypothetical protein n=1 Tax=Paraglaciecola sp. TaxID=1920173 RepID=UPI00329740C5
MQRNNHKTKFYLLITTLITIILIIGFARYFRTIFWGGLESPFFIHAHVLLFFTWVFFYTSQALLPAFGRVDLHKKLGRFGLPLALFIVVDGLYVTFDRFVLRIEKGDIEGARFFLLQPFTDMIIFPTLIIAAFYYRKKPQIHKRLMLLATLFLTVAAIVRVQSGIPGFNLLLWVSPIMIAILYDYYTKRIIHPVYLFGIFLFTLVYCRKILLWNTPLWDSFSNWMVSVFS